MTRIVLDTNVLVSAILTPFGTPASVLSAVLNGNTPLLYDDRIISEYRQVLMRKKFNFDADLVSHVLDYIEAVGEHISAPPLNIKLKDPFDLPFVEVAVAGHADVLVTGNKKHFPKLSGVQILTPTEFLKK